MRIATKKVGMGLRNPAGKMGDVPNWLQEDLEIDAFARRYGWDVETIEKLTLQRRASLLGIMTGESNHIRRERMKMKSRSK